MNDDLVELYAGPWQDFVARRSRLAAAARDMGDPAAANVWKGLKKPTRGAWLVNLIARHDSARLADVLRLGEELARAHREADPVEMRRLSRMRAAMVDSLAGRASALAAERGYAAPDSVRAEVAETLQAAMADPALADRVRAGTLAATVRAAGFGPVDLFEAPVAPVIPLRPTGPGLPAEPGPVPSAPSRAAQGDRAEARRLSRDLGRAEAGLEQSQARLGRAEKVAAEAAAGLASAQRRADALGVRLKALRAQLADLEADLRAARDRLDEAGAIAARRASECDLGREDVGRLETTTAAIRARLTELGVED